MVSCQHQESYTERNMMFMLMISSPLRNPFGFLSMCLLSCFMLSQLAIPSLTCSSILHLNLMCTEPFTYVSFYYYYFILFVTPQTSLVQVCISSRWPFDVFLQLCGLQCQPYYPMCACPCMASSAPTSRPLSLQHACAAQYSITMVESQNHGGTIRRQVTVKQIIHRHLAN